MAQPNKNERGQMDAAKSGRPPDGSEEHGSCRLVLRIPALFSPVRFLHAGASRPSPAAPALQSSSFHWLPCRGAPAPAFCLLAEVPLQDAEEWRGRSPCHSDGASALASVIVNNCSRAEGYIVAVNAPSGFSVSLRATPSSPVEFIAGGGGGSSMPVSDSPPAFPLLLSSPAPTLRRSAARC